MRQVFISYSSKEASQANEIVQALEAQGIECWIAPRNIRVGSNYTKDIPGAIRECPCFLLVLSRESQESKWVSKELTRAINQEKRVLPLLIEDFTVSEGFEFLLEDVQTRPYYRTKEQTLREVMEEIRLLMPQAEPTPAPTPAEPSAEECFRKGNAAYLAHDYDEAVKLYREAVEKGHGGAQCNLGFCYEIGNGVPQCYEIAVMWYRMAAKKGIAGAQYNLGVCYEYGQGVKKDLTEAKKWYQKAADQGHGDAKNKLIKLK